MSTYINIRTNRSVDPHEIFQYLADHGSKICVISKDFPVLAMGEMYESLRGVKITKHEQGYEVRVNVFSTEADYAPSPTSKCNPSPRHLHPPVGTCLRYVMAANH